VEQALLTEGARAAPGRGAARRPAAVKAIPGGATPTKPTHLQLYATHFPAVEINSSFYRPHAPLTYAKWAAAVPDGFRFAVKLPKVITHELRLAGARAPLETFLGEIAGLGPRLGCVLVQLPPSLAFEARRARTFLGLLRERHARPVALEPRHESWFTPAAEALLVAQRIARVAADPARVPAATDPGGDARTVYFRLHGSPRMYWSAYSEAALDALAARLAEARRRADDVWCIFDNTAGSAAVGNAAGLLARLM
jgi:uncharacterized protein YecE (DUF72 family)